MDFHHQTCFIVCGSHQVHWFTWLPPPHPQCLQNLLSGKTRVLCWLEGITSFLSPLPVPWSACPAVSHKLHFVCTACGRLILPLTPPWGSSLCSKPWWGHRACFTTVPRNPSGSEGSPSFLHRTVSHPCPSLLTPWPSVSPIPGPLSPSTACGPLRTSPKGKLCPVAQMNVLKRWSVFKKQILVQEEKAWCQSVVEKKLFYFC